MSAPRRLLPVLFALLLLAFSLAGCSRSVSVAGFADASCPFPAAVYYGCYGHVRFCYEPGRDTLSTMENYDMISLYDSGTYSLVISYTEGIEDLGETSRDIRALADEYKVVVGGERSYTGFGIPMRRSEITCTDGTSGAVLWGNTETGFVKIYYIIAPGAPESAREHVEQILETLSFREYFDNGEPQYDRVFIQ